MKCGSIVENSRKRNTTMMTITRENSSQLTPARQGADRKYYKDVAVVGMNCNVDCIESIICKKPGPCIWGVVIKIIFKIYIVPQSMPYNNQGDLSAMLVRLFPS